MLGEFVQPGTGHYNYPQEASGPLAAWFQDVAAARLPSGSEATPAGESAGLRALNYTTGWLIDPALMSSGHAAPIKFSAWVAKGRDPSDAYWYVSERVALAICEHMNPLWSKLPQMIGVYQDRQNAQPILVSVSKRCC